MNQKTAETSTGCHSIAQSGTRQRSAAQHSTAQHSTAQRSAAQHSTAQQPATHPKVALQQAAWGVCKGRAQGSWRQPHKGSGPGRRPLNRPTCCHPASAAGPLPGQRFLLSLYTLVPCCLLQTFTQSIHLMQKCPEKIALERQDSPACT